MAMARWRDGTMVRWWWRDRASRHRYRAIALSSSRHRTIAPSHYRAIVIAPSHHRVIVIAPSRHRHRAIAFKLSVQNTQNEKSRTTNWNFKEGPLNSRTFQGQIHFQGLFKENPKFKDFSRTVKSTIDFSSETTERNSTKLDRKQDFNVFYQVCVFLADRKTIWQPWPLICWDIFDFSEST